LLLITKKKKNFLIIRVSEKERGKREMEKSQKHKTLYPFFLYPFLFFSIYPWSSELIAEEFFRWLSAEN
jgi:hypothetical protein